MRRSDELEQRMRKLEHYHDLYIPENTHFIIRLDGKAFHTLTKNMEKPFDAQFNAWMQSIARVLSDELQAIFAETHSDEISFLFSREWNYHNRKVEKLVSISASMASSLYSMGAGVFVAFDSRVVLCTSTEDIYDYFYWRRADSVRNALNSVVFYELQKDGLSATQADRTMHQKDNSWKNEYLLLKGINFNDLDEKLRRGTGVIKYQYQKLGYNPIKNENVIALRSGYKEIAVPNGEEYRNLLAELLENESVDTCGAIS